MEEGGGPSECHGRIVRAPLVQRLVLLRAMAATEKKREGTVCLPQPMRRPVPSTTNTTANYRGGGVHGWLRLVATPLRPRVATYETFLIPVHLRKYIIELMGKHRIRKSK